MATQWAAILALWKLVSKPSRARRDIKLASTY
jgi:hypothetical protein